MTMQIHVDPAGLTQEQREAVAGFILAYPGAAVAAVAEIPAFIHKDTADVNLAQIGRGLRAGDVVTGMPGGTMTIVATNVDAELGKLQHDHESTLPAPAFDPDPVAAFGPLAPVATLTPTPAPMAAGNAPPPPAAIAPPPVNPGPVSSGAPATPGGADLDAKGFPWDARIHAESRAKVADGSWRMKRNLDPAVRATVESELRQVMGAPGVAPLAAPTVTTPAPAAPAFASSPTTTASPAPAAPPPADARAQFVGLVGRASAAIQAQKVTQAEVNQCCVDAGVPALPLLANRLDLVATVAANVDALIALRK